MQTHAYGLRTHITLTLQLIVNGNIAHLTSNTIMENFYRRRSQKFCKTKRLAWSIINSSGIYRIQYIAHGHNL